METAKVLQTPKARGQGTLVFDMTGFGLSNMDWACIKFILEYVFCLDAIATAVITRSLQML